MDRNGGGFYHTRTVISDVGGILLQWMGMHQRMKNASGCLSPNSSFPLRSRDPRFVSVISFEHRQDRQSGFPTLKGKWIM